MEKRLIKSIALCVGLARAEKKLGNVQRRLAVVERFAGEASPWWSESHLWRVKEERKRVELWREIVAEVRVTYVDQRFGLEAART